MQNTIKCEKCGTIIEIDKAVAHQFAEKNKLELERKKGEIEKEIEERTRKKVLEEAEMKIRDKENEAKESGERNRQLQEQILEQNKVMRELKAKDEDREVEMQKKLDANREKIREEASIKAKEEEHSKIIEKDKQLQDAVKANEELRRKLQQGSQQTQGEAFELEFEEMLQKEFPHDKITPVKKGEKGGDIIQEVWDSRGNYNGKILWELKNTKTPWKEEWITKLKSDQRMIKAEDAVLISEMLPKGVTTAGYRNGTWVTGRAFVIGLASALRAKLIQLYYARNSVKGKNEKMEVLYSYLTGSEFTQRIEAIVEAFTGMQNDVEKEKRYFAGKWSRDEKNIRQVIDNTFGMRGDVKGITGESLPQIKALDLLEIDAGNDGTDV